MIEGVTIRKLNGKTDCKVNEGYEKSAITNFSLNFPFQFAVVKNLVQM